MNLYFSRAYQKMKRPFGILAILLLSLMMVNSLYGQNSLDSLKTLLHSNATAKQKMEWYAFLGEAFYLHSPDSALKYTNIGLQTGDHVLPASRDSVYYDHLSTLLNNAAFINQKQANYYDAILLYQRSIDAYTHLNNTEQAITAKLNLGSLYYDIGEYDLSMSYLSKVRKQLGNTDDVALANCQLTIGSIFTAQGNEEAGLNNYFSAMALFKRTKHYSGEGRSYNKIGEIYLNRRDYPQAMENFRNALYNFSNEDDLAGMSESNNFIARLKFIEGEMDSAIFFGDQAFLEAQQINYPKNLRDASFLLFSIFEKQNNFQDALKMHLIYTKMDSLLSKQDAIKIATKEQLKEDFDKKTLFIKNNQDKKDAINQEALKRQQLISIVSVCGVGLLFLFLLLAIRNYRTKQKANIEISLQKGVVESKNKEILDSINYANRIQKTLLAHGDFLKEYLDQFFVLFRPKDIVSGDFYWATANQQSFYLAICDSTGHGVPGAFMSLLNISFLNEAINEKKIEKPGEIFDHARTRLIQSVSKEGAQDGMDGILFQFDKKLKFFNYASANNAPLVIRNEKAIQLDSDRMPVGKSPKETTAFSTRQFQVQSGDLVFAYTDGFADQFGGPKGKKFKDKTLVEFLLQNCNLPIEKLRIELELAFDKWKGSNEQVDDVLLFCLKIP